MTTRITAKKNRPLLRRLGEDETDRISAEVRARFATSDTHQIYADKREEARKYLIAAGTGEQTSAAEFPYLYAEAGLSAPNLLDLANLWISLDNSWKTVSAQIEKIRIGAKKKIRAAKGQAEIDRILAETRASLDAIGTAPPEPPKQKGPKNR
jgi:hypothetical protein